MPEPVIYDAAGDEVFDDELEHGGTYYDENGTAYVYDATGEFAGDDEDDDDGGYEVGDYLPEDMYEGELVGKAWNSGLLRASTGAGNWAKKVRGRMESPFVAGGTRAHLQAGMRGVGARGAEIFAANPTAVAAGGAGAVGVGGVGYGASRRRRDRVGKSLGNSVLEELSKALGDDERNQVISKAMDYVQVADRRAAEAMQIAKSLQDERDLIEFVDIAKSYDLPGDPVVLGQVLKSAAETMTRDELIALDQVLTAASEQALYGELGSGGNHQASGVMDEVYALAGQAVGKFDGLSPEQAITAMFEANPMAYDEYLSER